MKILDLFCGAGGLSYGLESVGHKVLIGVDFDDDVRETFQHNHPNSIFYNMDLSLEDNKLELVNESIKFGIDMVVGGPPCQGFSLKGKRLGLDDERNFLFKSFFEIVRDINPKYFIIENVYGIISAENGFFKDQITEMFSSLGYDISINKMDVNKMGVPQTRKRAIFIGSKIKPAPKIIPENIHISPVTVWEAISDLSFIESGESYEGNYKIEAESNYQKEMRINSDKIFNHTATNHSDSVIERLKMIPPEQGKEGNIPKELWTKSLFGKTWGRMEKSKPSPTITTRYDTPSSGKFTHPFLNRAITDREAARIQSFPDTFIFFGNRTSIMRQIGNAVPPKSAAYIGELINEQEK